MKDQNNTESNQAEHTTPKGPLALVGAWKEVGDEEIDALIEHIYAEREKGLK